MNQFRLFIETTDYNQLYQFVVQWFAARSFDDALLGVIGDWLYDRGDELGELIHLFLQAKSGENLPYLQSVEQRKDFPRERYKQLLRSVSRKKIGPYKVKAERKIVGIYSRYHDWHGRALELWVINDPVTSFGWSQRNADKWYMKRPHERRFSPCPEDYVPNEAKLALFAGLVLDRAKLKDSI